MENELTGGYIAHYFTVDAHGHLGNEAIMPAGGKLRGADGVVHEITPDYMPGEIVMGHGSRLVLGASKNATGEITLNPEIVAALERQQAAAAEYRESLRKRLAEQLALAS